MPITKHTDFSAWESDQLLDRFDGAGNNLMLISEGDICEPILGKSQQGVSLSVAQADIDAQQHQIDLILLSG